MAETTTVTNTDSSLAVKRSWVRVLILTVVSFGLYYIWWFYVVRKQVFAEGGQDKSAGLHTLGLFVPILNYILVYYLIKDAAALNQKIGAREVSIPLLTLLSIFVSVVGHVLIQEAWNDYWDKKTAGRATTAPYTAGEVIVSIIGVLFFGLMIFLIVLGAVLGSSTNSNYNGSHYNSPYYQ